MRTLLQKTVTLLNKSTQPLNDIAEKSGLPYDWLVGIKYERIKEPSVNRIQKLYEYLTGKRLSA